jgi:serine protease Do
MKRPWIPVLAASLAFAADAPAQAQRPSQPKSGAAAIVDGVVREVFRSPRRDQVDYLVQIDVRRSELGRGAVDTRRILIPAPGDPVYVHLSQTGAGGGHNAIPTERSSIRAYLYPREQGGWEGASPDWFEPSDVAFAPRGGDEPAPPAEPESRTAQKPSAPERGSSILQTLGVKADEVHASGRLVLKITEVTPGSPAQKAGFEKGDVIIGANGQGFTSLDQLADLLRKGGPMGELAVLNVQNGQQAKVRIEVPGVAMAEPRTRRPEDAPAAEPKRSLGVTVEPKRLGLRTALQVTDVQPGGPAQKAGIEKGDVLVEAAGIPLTDQAELQKVLDKSGPTLTIKVRDSRSGEDVDVEVKLGAARPGGSPSPTPNTPAPASGALTSRSFGITTEAATADLLPVVKVTSVTPGSAAEKAGIEVGDAITGVDDKIVFAPDLLEEALGKVGSSFTLTILDVKTGKKTPVKVDLGR